MNLNLFNQHQLDIGNLVMLQKRPEPFTPGEPRFWDDPHISKHMLAAHLDSQSDLASRKPETIDASVAWIMVTLGLEDGDRVLDLGCGPGLYSNRLAQLGLQVTGVDYSKRSIEYARWAAKELGLEIEYRCEDYLALTDESLYDAALLIYGEYCAFSPDLRRRLLANVQRTLKPGGAFVFDVSTPSLTGHQGEHTEWRAVETGFWRAGPHLVLSQRFEYPDEMIYLDQYLVIEADGTLSVYRNWFQDFDIEGIVREVEAAGLVVKSVWGDLTGEPYSAGCEWIGLVVEKM
jgi:2-polyprenyl-3-methyl-5-hydroxy-6-metoxy-1,4-benzoquinol methylase